MTLAQWKIGTRIYAIVGLLAVVAAAIGIIGVDAMRTYNIKVAAMDAAGMRAVIGERISGSVEAVLQDSRSIYTASTPAESGRSATQLLASLKKIQELLVKWNEMTEPEDREAMGTATAEINQFIKLRGELVQMVRDGSFTEVRVFFEDDGVRLNRTKVGTEIAALVKTNDERILRLRSETEWLYETRLKILLAVALLGVTVGTLLATVFVRRWVTDPLSQITASMRALAAGDASVPIAAIDRFDEIGEMARAVRFFQQRSVAADALSARVTDDVGRIAMAANQASSAVSQVSDGSNQQLDSLRKTSTAVSQSTVAISDVARSTQLASEQSRAAAALVNDGIARVSDMVGVVNAISESSSRVQRITSAIARIANQTNMLSLNAAIEAARAEEHGKGFAVVAEEVRKLAESSESLAQEIADIVERATDQAQQGVSMANDLNEKMRLISTTVRESDKLAGSIAAAMEQQQAAIQEVNSSLAGLTRIGQSNATAAEEITATMLDLSKLAEHTRSEVDKFKQISA
ncbi:MAG: methyl-accepting chemotaxis protein [Pseudomonadota bacterium]